MGKKRKTLLIAAISIVAIVITVVLVLVLNKEEAYRIIKIYEVEGQGMVTRKDVGEIEPYNNMLLESGDNIRLDAGEMTLKLDDDKYVYVEENTEFVLKAEGSSENSKTTIELLEGAITNDIQKKLSNDSSYEINTPNSTMAVRGTTYRVEIYYDEDGVCYTKVSVFDGEVVTKLVYPDGTISDDEVKIVSGKEVIIYENDTTTDYLEGVQDINYDEIPSDVVSLVERILGIEIDDTSDSTTEEGEVNETDAEEETATGTDATEEETYTVTFMYGGVVFGTQTVASGECATMPTLMPALTGGWDFDFSTLIEEDVVINWK